MITKIINYIKDSDLKIVYCNNMVNVINYHKIIEVKDNLVILEYNSKFIYIRGNDLKLNKLLDQEILVSGTISKIEL